MSLEELKTKVALLEQNADTGNIIHSKLEKSIEKLTELNASLKAMIIKQQAKLDKAEQIDEDIFITLESRRKEWDDDLKDLHSRISTQARELRDSQYHLESKQLKEIRNHVNIPLIIMGYFNPIFQFGVEEFCKKCNEIGIDGLIIPDLPIDIYLSNYKIIFEKKKKFVI